MLPVFSVATCALLTVVTDAWRTGALIPSDVTWPLRSPADDERPGAGATGSRELPGTAADAVVAAVNSGVHAGRSGTRTVTPRRLRPSCRSG